MDPKDQLQPHDDQGQPSPAPDNSPQYGPHAGQGGPHREAAASYIRDQINNIYQDNPPNQTKEQQAAQAQTPQNPYQRTHDPAAAAHANPQQHATNQWQRYHQAWQQYYQQYYQRYYMHHLHAAQQQAYQADAGQQQAAQKLAHNAVDSSVNVAAEESQGVSRQTATDELKNELINKVKTGAGRFRKSSHFMPIVAAIVVGLLFVFLQYNRVFVAQVKAYVSPGSATSQSIIVDPTTNIQVSQEPRLIVPKINVDAPVVYDVGSIAEDPIQEALKDGVVHYPIPGADSVPGQNGNTVLIGHSSNDVFDAGEYKFVFVLLNRLQKGDVFYVHHKGIRYTYSVTNKKIINPDQINELTVNTDKPIATLLSCTPPGTSYKRLLVFADQISPDPTNASKAPSSGATQEPTTLPANSPTILERLFGD